MMLPTFKLLRKKLRKRIKNVYILYGIDCILLDYVYREI